MYAYESSSQESDGTASPITVAGDDGEVLENDDVDPWDGPFTEYDKYGQPTGSAYVRCRDCGREVVTSQKEHTRHRDGCRFAEDDAGAGEGA